MFPASAVMCTSLILITNIEAVVLNQRTAPSLTLAGRTSGT